MQRMRISARTTSLAGTLFFVIIGCVYVYLIATGQENRILGGIRHLHFFGVILGILILTILNVIPVPAEFVSLFLCEVYGTWQGLVYSLVAGVLGAWIASFLCRWIARPFIEHASPKFLRKVDSWIGKRGAIGLLVLRWIPFIPYHLLNYVFGLLKVRPWPFIWTTFLGIIPYNLAIAGLFSGIRHGSMIWSVIGAGVLVLLLVIGWSTRRLWNKSAA